MQSAWFCVTCEVDNGCRIETWESLVYAPNAMRAQQIVKADWEMRDSETVAKVKSARKLSTIEIFSRQI